MAYSDYPSPETLAFLATPDSFISAGSNNRVYALPDTSIILRIAKSTRELWGAENPPTLHEIPHPKVLANAGIVLAEYHALDPKSGKTVVVGEVQRRVSGELLGLTTPERDSRYIEVVRIRDNEEKVGTGEFNFTYPAGSVETSYQINPDALAATNAKLFALADKILTMPDEFFTQMIMDVKAIEDAGYELDPSKSQNFFLLAEKRRVGFVDLMPFRGRRLPPNEISSILRGPANQTYYSGQTEDESARRRELMDGITARVIRACDQLGIAYAADLTMFADIYQPPESEEHRVRRMYGEKYGVTEAPKSVRPILLNEDRRPIGHAPLTAG